jgi:hypothetical protein
MPVLDTPADAIPAEVPYIRSELTAVHVEFAERILDERTVSQHAMRIRNGRTASPAPELEREGFQIATLPSRVARERQAELKAERTFAEAPGVIRDCWAETLPLIRELSGAAEVMPLHASAVRFSAGTGVTKRMTPAGWAHLDYDPEEAAVQLAESFELNGIASRPCSRFVLYQTWRPLSPPPQDFPLALCDGRTVRAEDIVPLDYRMGPAAGDVTYRSRGSRHSARHAWWYYPQMTIDEILVFKGFDSAKPDLNVLHTAFADRTVKDPVPRSSIETRYFALFD